MPSELSLLLLKKALRLDFNEGNSHGLVLAPLLIPWLLGAGDEGIAHCTCIV